MKKIYIQEGNILKISEYEDIIFTKKDMDNARDDAIDFWNNILKNINCKIVVNSFFKRGLTVRYENTLADKCGLHIPPIKKGVVYIFVRQCLECAVNNKADFRQVIANVYKHELGHFLGLVDCQNPEMLMYGGASKGINNVVTYEELEIIAKKHNFLYYIICKMCDLLFNK